MHHQLIAGGLEVVQRRIKGDEHVVRGGDIYPVDIDVGVGVNALEVQGGRSLPVLTGHGSVVARRGVKGGDIEQVPVLQPPEGQDVGVKEGIGDQPGPAQIQLKVAGDGGRHRDTALQGGGHIRGGQVGGAGHGTAATVTHPGTEPLMGEDGQRPGRSHHILHGDLLSKEVKGKSWLDYSIKPMPWQGGIQRGSKNSA